MSELNPTLADLTSRMTKDGRIDTGIIEMLNETNEMLDDITFQEATGVTENVSTVRTGLPSVAWRRLNYGVPKSKSKTKQVSDSIGMLEAYAEVDKKLVDIASNKEAYRLTENRAFIEAMNQEFQRALLFGDIAEDPAKILGLSARYTTGVRADADNAINVIDAGGTGDNLTSMWLLCWSPLTMFCTYPKGLPGGLKDEDLGEVTLQDAEGRYYQGYRSHYEWNVGFVLRDWRYAVRIANIDTKSLKNDPKTGDCVLADLMIDALESLPNIRIGRPAFYCNKTVSAFLRKQIRNAKNVNITMGEIAGKTVTQFDGVPIRRVDALTVGETAVPFK